MHLLSFLRDEVRLTALSSSTAVDPVSFHLITDQPLHFDVENARETHKVSYPWFCKTWVYRYETQLFGLPIGFAIVYHVKRNLKCRFLKGEDACL